MLASQMMTLGRTRLLRAAWVLDGVDVLRIFMAESGLARQSTPT